MNPILAADFKLPDDGLYQIAPEGEFVHLPTGFRQQLDADACQAIVADFTARAAAPGFPGLLVDYDHESLDMAKRTEAAGWILALEHRPGAGLWGRIRWTDAGEAAVRGGRYRFLSPVWKQEDCEPLGEGRLRPRRLLNAALTNNPNLKDISPLSNSAPSLRPSRLRVHPLSSPLANALQPGNERQRRAVFAKLRGAPMGATPLSSEELDAADAAQAKADEADRQRRLDLAKIIARRKAIEAEKARPKPYTSAAAEALERGIQHARKVQVKKPAAKVQQPAARAGRARSAGTAKTATQLKSAATLPRAYVRPTTDRLPGGVGLQWRYAPAQTAAGRNAPRLKPGESIYDYFARNYANRALANAGRPMRPAQRRALWALYSLPLYARSRVRAIRQALTPQPTGAPPADAAAEDVAAGLARLLALPLANASRPMSDEERRAMFAKLNQRGRAAAAPAPPPSGAMSDPPSADTAAGPLISHAPTRDSPARIEQLYAELKAVEAAAPQRPHPPASLELTDTRALRDDLMRQGRNAGDILQSVTDAEEHNRATAAEIEGMKAALKARGVAPDRIPAELQKQFDRRQQDYEKQVADWEKASARNAAALAAIDKKIAAEQIRMKEDWAKSDQSRANDEVRRQLAQDKARAAAELTARRKAETDAAKTAKAAASVKPADPLDENTAIKRRNKAYAEAIVRGDLDLAEKLAPGLDHNRNRHTVTALLPEPGAPLSPRNSKALAELLRALERTNPIDYPRR